MKTKNQLRQAAAREQRYREEAQNAEQNAAADTARNAAREIEDAWCLAEERGTDSRGSAIGEDSY